MSVATPRPPSPGGQNMPMMLRSQYAMYWHADVQALLVAAFVILYVLHTEYAVNRNIDIALYHCRANPTRPQCTNHPDFYPFTHSLGILNALRVLMSIVSLLTATSVYKYNHHKLVLQREKGAVAPSTTLARYPEGAVVLLEVAISMAHPFPWLEEITSNSNVFLFLFFASSIRLYLPLRCLFYRSKLNSNSAKFVSSLSGITFNPSFVIRAYFHLAPVLTTTCATAGTFIITSYWFRIFENVGCMELRSGQCGPITLPDSLWMVGVSMSSIGYRSIYVPRSSPGKILMSMSAAVGHSLALVNVALFLISLQLMDNEESVLHTWQRLKNKAAEKLAASIVMQRVFRFHKGYFHSLQWFTGWFGVKYREVSQRVPCEAAAVQAVLSYFDLRLDLKRKSLDEDYTIVRRVMAQKAELDMQKLIASMVPFAEKICGPKNAAVAILESPNFFAGRQYKNSPLRRPNLGHLPPPPPMAAPPPLAAPVVHAPGEGTGLSTSGPVHMAAPAPAPAAPAPAVAESKASAAADQEDQLAAEWAKLLTQQLSRAASGVRADAATL